MGCNFKSISAKNSCTESFSGIGTEMIWIPFSTMIAEPQLVESGDNEGEYEASAFDSNNAPVAFNFPIAVDTGQITANDNGKNHKAFTNVMTGRVEQGIDIMRGNLRTIMNNDFYYCLADTGERKTVKGEGDASVVLKKYAVVGHATRAVQCTVAYDSGTTVDSDSGYTLTFTAGPTIYPNPIWWGNITSFKSQADLDQLAKA